MADALSGFAHYVDGRWHFVNGSGGEGQLCPKSMPRTTCNQLTKLETPTPAEAFKASVESTWSIMKSNSAGQATVGRIHWKTGGAEFTLSGDSSPVVTFTFEFGSKKNFISTTARSIEVSALSWGDSIPFLEVQPSTIVTICIPQTTTNMGVALATKELPNVRDLSENFPGSTIETANPNGTLDNVVSSQNVLECNGDVSYLNPTVP